MTVQHDSETPAHGQQVITACAFIHHDFDGITKVFLPRRALTKKFLPGVFELPGGHIDFDEDIAEGLVREIHEEFGMRANIGDPFAAFTYLNPIKGSHSIEIIYFAQFQDPLKQISLDPEDHSEYRWVSASELQTALTARAPDNSEVYAIRKGFDLLSGNSLRFA